MSNYEQPTKRRWLSNSLRLLRIAAFAGCVVTSVAFGALWARSYYWNDTIVRNHSQGYWHFRSWKGRIEYIVTVGTEKWPSWLALKSHSTKDWQGLISAHGGLTGPEAFGFGWGETRSGNTRGIAPHWFFVLVAGALALAFKPKPRRRFSLGEVLGVMTVAAIAIAAITSLLRILLAD
jgi:hypothetical protein